MKLISSIIFWSLGWKMEFWDKKLKKWDLTLNKNPGHEWND